MKKELIKNIGDIAVGIAKEGLEKSVAKSQGALNPADNRAGSTMDRMASLLGQVGGKSGGGMGRGGGGGCGGGMGRGRGGGKGGGGGRGGQSGSGSL